MSFFIGATIQYTIVVSAGDQRQTPCLANTNMYSTTQIIRKQTFLRTFISPCSQALRTCALSIEQETEIYNTLHSILVYTVQSLYTLKNKQCTFICISLQSGTAHSAQSIEQETEIYNTLHSILVYTVHYTLSRTNSVHSYLPAVRHCAVYSTVEPGILYTHITQQAGSNSNENWKLGKKQSVVKLFYPKICKETIFQIFLHKWLANLRVFVNICKLPFKTFRVMQSKIC